MVAIERHKETSRTYTRVRTDTHDGEVSKQKWPRRMLGFVGCTFFLIVAFGGAARVDASVIARESAEVGPLPDDVEVALFFGEQPGPSTCSAVQDEFCTSQGGVCADAFDCAANGNVFTQNRMERAHDGETIIENANVAACGSTPGGTECGCCSSCASITRTFDGMKCRLYNGMLLAVRHHFAAHAAMWT